DSIPDGCPPGNFVFINDAGDTATCDPFNPPKCSLSRRFHLPVVHGKSKGSTLLIRLQISVLRFESFTAIRQNDGCPNAQIAFRERRSVRVCTAGSSTCPPGYFCQFSTLNRQFQCCGVSGGCPNDSVAFVGLSGEPERCVAGQSKCPIGFACQRSIGGHHICCALKARLASVL
ncbi:hypothetical protein COOONC_23126, partial [Cooperia oncophora]